MRWAWRQLLAAAIKTENPDLVLTGLQSEDLGLGQTGVIVAELLGLPHATLILHVEKTEAGLKVKRELEEGWFQTVELPSPAVLTIQSGGNKLRYATLMGIKRAKTKEVRELAASELDVDAAPLVVLGAGHITPETKIHTDSARHGEGSRGGAGGKAEVRGACPMSCVLVVLEERDGRISRISWEALAGGQRLGSQLGLPVCAAIVAAQTEASRRKCEPSLSQSCVRGASAARSLHCRRVYAGSPATYSVRNHPRTWFSHTPIRFATLRRHWLHASVRCSSAT